MTKSKQPKLVLVNIENTANHIAPMAAFGYMSAFLKDRIGYHNTKQVSFVYDIEDPLKKILDEEPDIVGFRTISTHIKQVKQLSRDLKETYGIPVLWGGPHITSVPLETPSCIDCAVIGDGEETITELMQLFLKEGRFPTSDLHRIKGIAYWAGGQLCRTTPRPAISDLDSVPCPDYSICDEECFTPRERWLWLGEPVVGLPYLTSRGCAFRCNFCQPAVFEGKVRKNSMDKVFSDMKQLQDQFGAQLFALYDPIFANHASRVRDFYEGAVRFGMQDAFYYVQLFARNFHEDMARELAKLNAFRIFFGFESGSEKILKYLKNGVVSIKDNERASRLADKYQLRIEGCFMTGVPDETEEDLELTKSFIRNEYIPLVQVAHTVPQPGTKLWDEAAEKGLISREVDWEQMEGKDNSPEVNDLLVYLNPAMPKDTYRKHSDELYELAARKSQMGREQFSDRFLARL